MGKRIVALLGAIIGLTLVLGLVATPFWLGMQAEEGYQAWVAELGTDGASVGPSSYDRSFLGATADTTYTVPSNLGPMTIKVTSSVAHGPFPFDDQFGFEPKAARLTSVVDVSIKMGEVVAKFPPIRAVTNVDFGGIAQAELQAPAGKQQFGDKAVEWQAVSGQARIERDTRRRTLDLTVPQLKITEANKSSTFTKFQFASDQQRGASGLQLGSFNVGVDRLVFDGAGPEIGGLQFTTSAQETGGSVTMNFTLRLRDLKSGDTSIGPGELGVVVRKLDAATLAKIDRQLQAQRKQGGALELGKLVELMAELANKGPELELTRLSIKTKEGEASGKFKLGITPSREDLKQNPMLVLRQLTGEGEFTLTEGMMAVLADEEIRKEIEGFKEQGKLSSAEAKRLSPRKMQAISSQARPAYVQRVAKRYHMAQDGNNYKVQTQLKRGELTVNGEAVQLGGQ